MSVTMRCTVIARDGLVVLHDNDEYVPVTDGFNRLGLRCELDDPDLVIVVAGPRANGSWVTITLDDKPVPTVH